MGFIFAVAQIIAVFFTLRFFVVRFKESIEKIVKKISDADLCEAWSKIVIFSIYVIGLLFGMQTSIYFNRVAVKMLGGLDVASFWIYEVFRSCVFALFGAILVLMVLFICSVVVYVFKNGGKSELKGEVKPSDIEEV